MAVASGFQGGTLENGCDEIKLNLYQRKVDFDVFGSFTNFSFQHFQKYQTNQAKQLQLQWNFNSPESVKCHLFFLNFVNFYQGKIVL